MGLTVIPYQLRPSPNSDPNQRFRRLHMRAPFRPLTASIPAEFTSPLEINTRQSNLSLSINIPNHQLRHRRRSSAK
jgi:hypothetical protein